MLLDRLYGKIAFPKIVENLLTCPGLLRLREVRLGNVPFLAFPSLAGCSRYEHSIGVCHLAQIASQSLGLDVRDSTELMIAALYHDVATPPFAHALEEVLQELFGFNHEQRLHDLITGRTNDLGRERAQVFLGRTLRLHSAVQKQQARELGLDVFRIADLALGKSRLGPLVNSTIDLDNIDNIVRATSTLGIPEANQRIAESLARSYTSKGEEIVFAETARTDLRTWQSLRWRLYDMIYSDIKDFSIETMVKHATRTLISEGELGPEDWCLTEEELVHDRFMRNSRTKEIAIRIRTADTYPCVGFFSLSGRDVIDLLEEFLVKLKSLSESFFNVQVIPNFFIDKRWRSGKQAFVHRPLTEEALPTLPEPTIFVGLFTPDRTEKYLARDPKEFKARVISTLPSGVRFEPGDKAGRSGWLIDDWLSA